MMSVVGCIDANGSIIARACKEIGTHRPEEKKGKTWRWLVWSQEFIHVGPRPVDEMTDDEVRLVCDWLVRKGYADEYAYPPSSTTFNREFTVQLMAAPLVHVVDGHIHVVEFEALNVPAGWEVVIEAGLTTRPHALEESWGDSWKKLTKGQQYQILRADFLQIKTPADKFNHKKWWALVRKLP